MPSPVCVVGANTRTWLFYTRIFNEEKGYGFISPGDGGEDLFVHYSGIVGDGFRSLEEGAKVSYEPQRGKKGMQAQDVSKV